MLRHSAPERRATQRFGEYDLDADTMAKQIREWAQRAFSISSAAAVAPRHNILPDESCSRRISAAQTAGNPRSLRLSGLEPLNIGEDSLFVNVVNAPTSPVPLSSSA